MRVSLNKAANIARASASLIKARAFSCTTKTEWNDRFSMVSPGMAGASSWGVQRFLEEIGTNGREARYWLKVFQHRDANPEQPFAVLQVCSSVFKRPHMLSKLASSLAFLQRNGLTFIIVHGTNKGSAQERYAMTEQAIQLADVLESQGAKTRPFINCSGVLKLNDNDAESSLSLNTDALSWSISSGFIPIISSLAETGDGRIINVCPIRTTAELASHFQPLKVMHLNSKGGLTNERGRVIEAVNLPNDFEIAASLPWCNREVHSRLGNINSLLEKLPFTSSVVITSADTIIQELFTHRGSGTIFKKREQLNVHKDFESINVEKLFNLIEKTFKKRLSDSYLSEIRRKLIGAYITESYSAAAVITRESDVKDVPYLDKFAVSLQNQGLGAGETIWEKLKQDFPSLFWRSKGSNRINPWYFTRSEGSWTNNSYTVFWYGINQPTISNEIVHFATSHPSSFADSEFADYKNLGEDVSTDDFKTAA